MEPSLALLLERLLWPVPRIRWEAARGLAHLIRSGDTRASDALLAWTARRGRESEAALGLGVIHAFDLGEHLVDGSVSASVRRPSLLSDWMLETNFGRRERYAPLRYAISPSTPANVDQDDLSMFERYKTVAAAPIFLRSLKDLESRRNFGFVDRWRHDWTWLQRSDGAEAPDTGIFFGPDGRKNGVLLMGQGELMVSAFLRTLAYALHTGRIERDEAEYFALLGLPLNRGLADVEPVTRPRWSFDLLNRWKRSGRKLLDELWASAKKDIGPGERLAALSVMEADERDFIEISVDVVIGKGALGEREPGAHSPEYRWVTREPGFMAGEIFLGEDVVAGLAKPTMFSCRVPPEQVGRVDASIALHVKLACLGLGWRSGRVACTEDAVQLSMDEEVQSRWIHWYANWEPTKHWDMDSNVCSKTTVSESVVHEWSNSTGAAVALLARVRLGTREHTYVDHTVEEQKFWM